MISKSLLIVGCMAMYSLISLKNECFSSSYEYVSRKILCLLVFEYEYRLFNECEMAFTFKF